MNWYNEIDPYAAQWLRNLIEAGHIAPGIVDERSIVDVSPDELLGYTQCHFFAGIGVWSYALRQAGWPDDKPVWTGSCPCQPFSSAGKGNGFDDERHLWPHFQWLIQQCQPTEVLGEQVASKDADAWIDLVHADMEAMGYAFGCVAFPSASVGAPHIRDRSYWVAHSLRSGQPGQGGLGQSSYSAKSENRKISGIEHDGGRVRMADMQIIGRERECLRTESGLSALGAENNCGAGSMANANSSGFGEDSVGEFHHAEYNPESCGGVIWVADASGIRCGCGSESAEIQEGREPRSDAGRELEAGLEGRPLPNSISTALRIDRPELLPGPVNGLWSTADWLQCRDGKWRPASPKPQPLVDGSAISLGCLRTGTIEKIEEEIDAWAVENKIIRGKILRELLQNLGEKAKQCWEAGRLPGLHEAPFLLAFMRQLSEQGWFISECLPVSCEEINKAVLRSVRSDTEQAGTSCEYRLDGQQTGEHTDALSFLSSLLARHALEAWGNAHSAYAETSFVLASNARSRTGRLKGYGNAINAYQAQIFIEGYLEARNG